MNRGMLYTRECERMFIAIAGRSFGENNHPLLVKNILIYANHIDHVYRVVRFSLNDTNLRLMKMGAARILYYNHGVIRLGNVSCNLHEVPSSCTKNYPV